MKKYTVEYQYWYDIDTDTIYDGVQLFLADGIFDLDEQWKLFSQALEKDGIFVSDYAIMEVVGL